MNKLRVDKEYAQFQRQLRPMLRSRENQIMLEFAFWEGVQPEPNGVYELRSYLLKPGRMLEWETEWYISPLELLGNEVWKLVASMCSLLVRGFLNWENSIMCITCGLILICIHARRCVKRLGKLKNGLRRSRTQSN